MIELPNAFRQVREIVWMNLQSIPQRWGASLVIVVGIAGVVAVLVAMLSMSAGLTRTLGTTGRVDRAIVLRAGSNAELSSFLDRALVTLIKQDPAIARGRDGLPLASGEIIVITEVARKGESGGTNVTLRGVEPNAFELRPELTLVQGRRFRPGLQELLVGVAAQRQFAGLEVGRTLRFKGSDWRIVGVFESDGDGHESELWADTESVQNAFDRSGYSSVLAQMTSVAAFDGFRERLKNDPQLTVDVEPELEYFSKQSETLTFLIGLLTNVITVIMAIGALFGALNTMYSAVSARTREIGTLRALGFGRLPVIASVMAEALVLAVAGGLLGALLAYLMFNGYSVSTLSPGSFTQVAFNFAVTPALLAQGLAWALLIGFLGGLMPALRAARIPVTEALRAT
ncbi:ABC transporter permease [Aerolutibacter ruishenii]|uniref:Putative ABC transport system permease protein n=1 Tax=Aerolutibacter ruishenii TaxID=686800 RepID=A0A562M367_9GAMM|nr:ABC transporter permease [Lysobacter ruishenii]TWI14385.1 putative ABC transport system permease protein [Lysobacter ruishenii]